VKVIDGSVSRIAMGSIPKRMAEITPSSVELFLPYKGQWSNKNYTTIYFTSGRWAIVDMPFEEFVGFMNN